MKKNNLDEAQELKMLRIEHNAYGIAFWGLLIALLVQRFTGEPSFRDTVGEFVVFSTMCIYVVIAGIKNGVWDRKLKPNGKTNLVFSLIAGAVMGALQFAYSYSHYGHLGGSAAAAVFLFIFTSALSYGGLALTSWMYKKRVKQMEDAMDE